MENATPSERKLHVFVVEDSPIVRERLVAMLQAADAAVVGEAASPAVAIAGILATRPDLVLLDVHLVDGTGIDVLRAIRPRLPAVTFIVLTNYTVPIYRDAYLRAGAAYYLDKSHEFDNARDIVAGLQRKKNDSLPPQGASA